MSIFAAMALLTDGDIIGLIGVYAYVAVIILIARLLRSKTRNPRKIVHILTGGIVFFWWLFDTRWVMSLLAAFPFVPILLLFTPISPIEKLRNSSLGTISAEGHPYGLVFYAISWTVIAWFLFDDLFAASVAIASMSFGDGMGDLIGKRFGKRMYLPNRTIEGSSAVFLFTTVSVIIIGWFYFDIIGYSQFFMPTLMIPFGLGIGLLVACLEAITPGSVDNLVLPLLVGLFLHVIGA
jgi:phytol kinase